jgi:hypothetical protein
MRALLKAPKARPSALAWPVALVHLASNRTITSLAHLQRGRRKFASQSQMHVPRWGRLPRPPIRSWRGLYQHFLAGAVELAWLCSSLLSLRKECYVFPHYCTASSLKRFSFGTYPLPIPSWVFARSHASSWCQKVSIHSHLHITDLWQRGFPSYATPELNTDLHNSPSIAIDQTWLGMLSWSLSADLLLEANRKRMIKLIHLFTQLT